MDIASLLISLISGAVGGNVTGKASPEIDLGTLGNTIAGLIGGSAGGYILQLLNLFGHTAAAAGAAGTGMEAAHGLNIAEILANVASSGVGGALLTYIAGLLKSYSGKAS